MSDVNSVIEKGIILERMNDGSQWRWVMVREGKWLFYIMCDWRRCEGETAMASNKEEGNGSKRLNTNRTNVKSSHFSGVAWRMSERFGKWGDRLMNEAVSNRWAHKGSVRTIYKDIRLNLNRIAWGDPDVEFIYTRMDKGANIAVCCEACFPTLWFWVQSFVWHLG